MEETSLNQEPCGNSMSMASYTIGTSWEIADGSLSDSIIFDALTAEADAEAEADADAVVPNPKSTLSLRPASLDSSPCKITITFAQQHQVRQVYVRSTARVYEIYYVPNSQKESEYLCTVRCGVAIRDDQVLQSNCTVADVKVADEVLDEMNGKRSSSSSPNEDGWVDVKLPPQDNANYFSAGSENSAGNIQDFYEATAEIADANPCMSITIRLLSLQDKGCVFVDEIYVFADLVDSIASENRADQAGDTNASSLMGMHMLFPAMLQLSKAGGLSQMQNKHALDTEKEKTEGTLPKVTEQKSSSGKHEKEETSLSGKKSEIGLAGAGCLKLNQNDITPEVSDEISKQATSCDRTERLLDQLVSRVTKLEDLLQKFEYNMLKPINSINSRLGHVEQQVEELCRKSENLDMKTCKIFSAPEFSCYSECPNSDLSASSEKDCCFPLADESVHMANSTESFPTHTVKLSEFQNHNDDEDDLSATNPSAGEPKLSIDEALASALAGFMSSSEPHRYTQALLVKAPDFPSEDDGGACACAQSMQSESVISSKLLHSDDGTDSLNHVNDLFSSSSSLSTKEGPVEVQYSSNDIVNHSETAEETAEKSLHTREGTVTDSRLPVRVDHDTATTDFPQLTDSSQLLLDDESDIMNQFLKNQTLDTSVTTHAAEDSVKKSEPKQNFCEDMLNVLGLPTSILDVKFDSFEKPQSGSPLEFLLGEMGISDYNQHDSGLLDGGGVVDEGNLISVTAEDGENGRKQDKFEDEACGEVEGPAFSFI